MGNTTGLTQSSQTMQPLMQGPSRGWSGSSTSRAGGHGGYHPYRRPVDSYRPSRQPVYSRPVDSYRPTYSRPQGQGNPGGGGGGGAPAPTPGQPGWRPPNYQPNIPPAVHQHAAYGGWNGNHPTGGHMLHGDLPSTHPDPTGYNAGSVGWGAQPPFPGQTINRPTTPHQNGVYQYPYPPVQFEPRFSPETGGAITKPHDSHTMFPQGMPSHGMAGIADNVWQSPQTRFWPEADGGGAFSGTGPIPQGYPHAGMPIKVNGTYGPDGQATGYWPSRNQPTPPPSAPSTGGW